MKKLRCQDLGMDCGFEACEETAEEVLKTAIEHARAIHGLKEIPEKNLQHIQESIQDSFCVPKGGYNPGRGNTY